MIAESAYSAALLLILTWQASCTVLSPAATLAAPAWRAPLMPTSSAAWRFAVAAEVTDAPGATGLGIRTSLGTRFVHGIGMSDLTRFQNTAILRFGKEMRGEE